MGPGSFNVYLLYPAAGYLDETLHNYPQTLKLKTSKLFAAV